MLASLLMNRLCCLPMHYKWQIRNHSLSSLEEWNYEKQFVYFLKRFFWTIRFYKLFLLATYHYELWLTVFPFESSRIILESPYFSLIVCRSVLFLNSMEFWFISLLRKLKIKYASWHVLLGYNCSLYRTINWSYQVPAYF